MSQTSVVMPELSIQLPETGSLKAEVNTTDALIKSMTSASCLPRRTGKTTKTNEKTP